MEMKLTAQQELFCLAYTSLGETFRNATRSYSEAYDITIPEREDGKLDTESGEYKQCSVCGSRLLRDDKIRARIRERYLAYLNDNDIDAKVSEIIQGGTNLEALQGVKIYNDLKQRITKKVDVTSAGRPLQGMTDEELAELAGS